MIGDLSVKNPIGANANERSLSEGRLAKYRIRVLRGLLILVILAATIQAGRLLTPVISREVRYRLALRQVTDGRLENAESRLNSLISESPRDTRPRLALVQVYRRQGRITEAEEVLQRAVELGLSIEEARSEHELLRHVDAMASGQRSEPGSQPLGDSRKR